MRAPDWKARAERLQDSQKQLVHLLLEACEFLQQHAGFKVGTGLDGAFLDTVAQQLTHCGIYDLAWVRRVEAHYGKDRVAGLLQQANMAQGAKVKP